MVEIMISGLMVYGKNRCPRHKEINEKPARSIL